MAGSFSSCAVGGGAPRPAPLFLLGLLVVLGLARRRVGG
jgi:MYXO-CTERM domain-containing protein